jgi:hypothetical protein
VASATIGARLDRVHEEDDEVGGNQPGGDRPEESAGCHATALILGAVLVARGHNLVILEVG